MRSAWLLCLVGTLVGCAATSPTRLPEQPTAAAVTVDGTKVWVMPHPSQPRQWVAQLEDWFGSTFWVDGVKHARQMSLLRRAVESRAGCAVTDVAYPAGAEQMVAVTGC